MSRQPRLSRVESLEEMSFSNSIERSVGAADATLQHLATAKETFGDLEAAYRTFKQDLEIVKTEHATKVGITCIQYCKVIEQYFHVTFFLKLYKLVLSFELVNEISKCNH